MEKDITDEENKIWYIYKKKKEYTFKPHEYKKGIEQFDVES